MNTDKQAVRQIIEAQLRARLAAQPINVRRADGSPTRDALREQAAFLAGAMTALQAMLPNEDASLLTDFAPPAWIIAIMRNELV